MPRRERRSGVGHIANDKERDVTFYKRRFGLYKGAADLSALTGARVSVVLETDNGKIHSFGTPSAKPLVDAYLSGTAPYVDKVKEAKIAQVQSEVARLDMENTTKDKTNQIYIERMKKVQDENPGIAANLIFLKDEDLDLEDLHTLFNDLSRVQEDYQNRLTPLHHGHQAQISRQSMTTNMLPPAGLSYDHMQATCLSKQSPWSHHPSQQQLLSVPLSSPPEQTLSPLHTVKVPKILHTAPSASPQQLTSLLQPVPHLIHKLPPQQDRHLPCYPSPCNTVQPQQNYVSHNITFKHNLEDSALPVNSGVNNSAIDGLFGRDSWGYPLSNNVYHNGFLGVEACMGYNGTNVGQSSMETNGWFNAPPEYSCSRQDEDIHALYGGHH
ncbi:hypothetical protein QYE76_062483 [Lolium multiflorum]|uniref:MADS-box domain-containing protein n=1 Tax=Lolium multiflorum TaxID=4521 RepID=A0AAD8S433_LOLMU|nr:hypothetical protein QYE76_062483 [Lolium multiflorum]